MITIDEIRDELCSRGYSYEEADLRAREAVKNERERQKVCDNYVGWLCLDENARCCDCKSFVKKSGKQTKLF